VGGGRWSLRGFDRPYIDTANHHFRVLPASYEESTYAGGEGGALGYAYYEGVYPLNILAPFYVTGQIDIINDEPSTIFPFSPGGQPEAGVTAHAVNMCTVLEAK
jgi:hypothetical protein